MRKILAVAASAACILTATPSAAEECRGLLSALFGVKPLFSCEQRAAMMGAGTAMMQPPAHPVFIAPAPVDILPPAPKPIIIVPANGNPPTVFFPLQ
jgi:hypothetical protein